MQCFHHQRTKKKSSQNFYSITEQVGRNANEETMQKCSDKQTYLMVVVKDKIEIIVMTYFRYFTIVGELRTAQMKI